MIIDEIKKMYAMHNNMPYTQNESFTPTEKQFSKSLTNKYDDLICDDETDFFYRLYSEYYRLCLVILQENVKSVK